MKNIAAFAVGLLFGLGLVVSQMTNPAKIIAFLDIAGSWDPSLAVVMAAALAVSFVGYRLVLGRPKPVFETAFQLPAKTIIDRPLVVGAAVFGAGWAMAGLCPGPGFSSLAAGGFTPLAFLAAMAVGMKARDFVKL